MTTAAWTARPTWHIVAGNDRMFSPMRERATAVKLSADAVEIPSSHVALLSHPNAALAK